MSWTEERLAQFVRDINLILQTRGETGKAVRLVIHYEKDGPEGHFDAVIEHWDRDRRTWEQWETALAHDSAPDALEELLEEATIDGVYADE